MKKVYFLIASCAFVLLMTIAGEYSSTGITELELIQKEKLRIAKQNENIALEYSSNSNE